jgi:Sushi repeat (SCR repeat)
MHVLLDNYAIVIKTCIIVKNIFLYCRPGWGYASSGQNETYIYCQNDGTWSNLQPIEKCICEFSLSCTLKIMYSNCIYCNYFQYCPAPVSRHQPQMGRELKDFTM